MTTPEDPVTYDRAVERIGRSMVAVAILGTALAWVAGGWRWGAGFLFGALISGLNFRWLRRLVESLGPASLQKPKKLTYRSVFLAFRYLLLAGAGYVILRLSEISLPAAITGLFVLVGAVFIEVVFEIVHARK